MEYIGNIGYLPNFVNTMKGETRKMRMMNAANELMSHWIELRNDIEVKKDHPRYHYIMNEIYHEGGHNTSQVRAWTDLYKNEPNWEDNMWICLLKLWSSILAAEYIHQMETTRGKMEDTLNRIMTKSPLHDECLMGCRALNNK